MNEFRGSYEWWLREALRQETDRALLKSSGSFLDKLTHEAHYNFTGQKGAQEKIGLRSLKLR